MTGLQLETSAASDWMNDSHWKIGGSSSGPLYRDPPVDETRVILSNRILLVCSRRNLSEARKFKDRLKDLMATVGLAEQDVPVSLATFAPIFWADFFGVEDFLDPTASLTKPRLMVTDGAIVDDINATRGDEVCIGRLRKISQKWGVELRVLEGPLSFV